ncbi:hypothetical protein BH23BAC1_BH23BAC1_11840 [soil metagenome]
MFALIFIIILFVAAIVSAYTVPNEKLSHKKNQRY